MTNLKFYSVITLLIMVITFSGCSDERTSDGKPSSNAKQRYLIAYSQAELVNTWRVSNQKDMEEWASTLAVDFVSKNANQSTSKQLADIKDMLASKPDVLILSPLESKALVSVVDLCEQANVPLVVIDRKIDSEPGNGIYKTEITQSHVISGRLLAEKAVELLKNKYDTAKGKVVHISGLVNASPVIDSKKGWDQVMMNYPEIKTIAVAVGGFTETGGRIAMENILEKFPRGQIDIVHTDYSAMTMGALSAIKKAGRTELLGYLLGEGGHYKAIEAVINGDIARETQTPPFFGELAIKSTLSILKGVDVSARQKISIKVFDTNDKQSSIDYLKRIRRNGMEF